jgi:hypothetical protein
MEPRLEALEFDLFSLLKEPNTFLSTETFEVLFSLSIFKVFNPIGCYPNGTTGGFPIFKVFARSYL